MNALFNQNVFFNVSFGGHHVEHIKLNDALVWSRPNLFFTQSTASLPRPRLKTGDIAVVDNLRDGEWSRAERVASEAEFAPANLSDGFYLILGE